MIHLINCPECAKDLQVPEELLGRKVQCPECLHTFTAELPPADKPPSAAPSARKPAPAEADPDDRKTERGSSKETRRRYDDDYGRRREEEDEFDERLGRRRSIRRSRADEKPGKVTSIGVMALVGGIISILIAVIWGGATCCIWPGAYYSLVIGILAIVKGSALLGDSARDHAPPIGTGVMLIINVINGDVMSVVLGILILVFCNDDEVTSYLAKRS